ICSSVKRLFCMLASFKPEFTLSESGTVFGGQVRGTVKNAQKEVRTIWALAPFSRFPQQEPQLRGWLVLASKKTADVTIICYGFKRTGQRKKPSLVNIPMGGAL
ncbi:MAG: hypothetical protein ACYC55_01885, partial [Candidatus Geothermincolia bacterium]